MARSVQCDFTPGGNVWLVFSNEPKCWLRLQRCGVHAELVGGTEFATGTLANISRSGRFGSASGSSMSRRRRRQRAISTQITSVRFRHRRPIRLGVAAPVVRRLGQEQLAERRRRPTSGRRGDARLHRPGGAFRQRPRPSQRTGLRPDLRPHDQRRPTVPASARYMASGVGFSAGGSMPKLLAVMQVMEKLPMAPTSATNASRPMVFSAAA